MSDVHSFDWSDLAFGSKKPLKDLHATFIMAPREISEKRFLQMVKQYLPAGPIVLGIAKENYIDGFVGQPHFRTLKQSSLQKIIDKVNGSQSPHRIYTLRYFQREVDHVIAKLHFRTVILVNGSWQYAFHNRSTYYTLVNRQIPFERVSPFADEQEAKMYANDMQVTLAISAQMPKPQSNVLLSDAAMLAIADKAAMFSYDHCFQTGTALGKQAGEDGGYELLAFAHNAVVPYDTYALHHGSLREKHFSPPNDLNYYDTIHAEASLIVQAQKRGINLQGTTLFINLLPCPTCARMISQTDIAEIVYRQDHSDGYAVQLFEQVGKTVRRIVRDTNSDATEG